MHPKNIELPFQSDRQFKGSPDESHFIFKTIVGKSRIRHKTILNLNDVIFNRLLIRSNSSSLNFRVVACRIRPFPTLNPKMKWIWSELSLNYINFEMIIS